MFIKRPGSDRTSYALVGNQGKTIKDPRIDQVNKDLKAGVSVDILEKRMQFIKASFLPIFTLSSENLKLIEQCHAVKLVEKPWLRDPDSLKGALHRAGEALGGVSVKEGTSQDLLKAIKHIVDPGERYHRIRAINELLRFAGRDLRLRNRQPKSTQVDFIELNDFLVKLTRMPFKERAVLGALFATGARWGELPRLTLQLNSAHVVDQVDKKGLVVPTKNKTIRTTPVLPQLKHYLDLYLTMSYEERLNIRLKNHKKYLKAARFHLGLCLHDLRHCYAVFMAKKGVETSRIAQFIGDTERVCKDHYSRYVPSNSEIEDLVKRLG